MEPYTFSCIVLGAVVLTLYQSSTLARYTVESSMFDPIPRDLYYAHMRKEVNETATDCQSTAINRQKISGKVGVVFSHLQHVCNLCQLIFSSRLPRNETVISTLW